MGKTIEGVTVTSQMPKGVLNMSLTPSQGTHTFDPVTKVRSWASNHLQHRLYTWLEGRISQRNLVLKIFDRGFSMERVPLSEVAHSMESDAWRLEL